MRKGSKRSDLEQFYADSLLKKSLVNFLGEDSDLVLSIAIDACNAVLNTKQPKDLEELDLNKRTKRYALYYDIELYLKSWLISSIDNGRMMPTNVIRQSIDNRKLYVDIIQYIRKHCIESLSSPDETYKPIIKCYLDYLLGELGK